MHANRGDQIVIETTTLAAARRRGEVLEVIGRRRTRALPGAVGRRARVGVLPRPGRPGATKGSAMRAGDVMTSPVITLRPEAPVQAAAALLCSHGFTSAPVVDAAGASWGSRAKPT